MQHYSKETIENLDCSHMHKGYDKNTLKDMLRTKFMEELAINSLKNRFSDDSILAAELHEQIKGIPDYYIKSKNLQIEWKLWSTDKQYEYFPIELSRNYKCGEDKDEYLKELKSEPNNLNKKYIGWLYSYPEETIFLFSHCYWLENFFIHLKDLKKYIIDNWNSLRVHPAKSSGGIVIMLKRYHINNIKHISEPISSEVLERYNNWIKTEHYQRLYNKKMKETNNFNGGFNY